MAERHTFRAEIVDAGGGGAFVRMGEPCHILIVIKDIRNKIGKTFANEVDVTIEEDLDPRLAEVPGDLKEAFAKNSQAQSFFNKLSYQKEYVTWIEEAKRDETRQGRIVKMIEMLKEGQKGR